MATRLKTVQFAAPVLTSAVNNTLTNIPQFTVYLPEATKTIKKAWVEVSFDDIITATGGTLTTKTINLRLGANAYTSTTNAQTATHTSENASYQLTRDFTSHFTTNWTGTSMTCDIQVQFNHSTGTTTGMVNVCAILYVTYEYDDTATTQLKSVMIPLDAPKTALATTKTSYDTVPALDTYLPENSKTYRNIYVVFHSNTLASSTTDFTVSFELSSLGSHTTQIYEQALNTDRFVRYVWDVTSMTTNVTHTFNMWSSLANTMDAPQAYMVVTYEYNESTSTSIMNSLMLPMEIDSPNGTSAADFQRSTRELWVQESNVSLQKLAYYMFWQGRGNEAGLNVRVGTGSFSAYTMAGSQVLAGSKCLMNRNDAPTGLTFARGRNELILDVYNTSTTIRNDAAGGYFIINYTSDKHADGSGAHNHTVMWPMYTNDTGGFVQGKYTTADAIEIPETNYFLTAVGFNLGYIQRAIPQGVTLKAERLVAEGGLIFERIYSDTTGHDNEMGYYTTFIQARFLFDRWTGDHDSSRIDIEQDRRYYMYSSGTTCYWDRLVLISTYHSITYDVADSITGFSGTVDIGLHRAGSGEKVLSTSRSGDGAFSMTWYDNTEELFVQADDGTNVGRSQDTLAS